MKVKSVIVIAGAAFLASCSGSPSSMLKKGDPKICVSNTILSKAYEVVRENAQAPYNGDLIKEGYDDLKSKWLSKLSFAADNVTSTSVDRENQTVTCSGKLQISASGVSEEADAPFAYQVKANLSDDSNPIVSVDMSSLQGALASVLGKVAQPDFETAQAKHDENDDALTKQDEDLVKNTPGASEKLQARSRANLVQSDFSGSELAMIDRIYLSHMMCMSSDGRNRDAFCRKEVRLNKEAKSNDLCSTAGNEWYHCSRENELQQQRDALRNLSDGNATANPF